MDFPVVMRRRSGDPHAQPGISHLASTLALRRPAIIWLCLASCLATAVDAQEPARLRITPAAVHLDRPEASQQLLAVVEAATGGTQGVTRAAAYRIADPSVAAVDSQGRVTPLTEGTTTVHVRWNSLEADAEVVVTGLHQPAPVSFRSEVSPILTKAGCNSGGCHGKAEGQNGFKLSIFGFDVEGDHAALVKEGRGRRITISAPEQSLLLRKGLAETPHGGGQKLTPGSAWHRLLLRWIAEGAALDQAATRRTTRIVVEPAALTLGFLESRQLRVTAINAEGRQRCVTSEAEFQSNADTVATVAADGLLTTKEAPGEAAILVRYMGHVTTCRVALPIPSDGGSNFQRPPEANYIDKHVWDKLEAMGLEPSPLASDSEFLRRVTLDTIGRLPTVAETRAFLADEQADKRARWIDKLLEREEYATYWAMRWADILRVDKSIVSPQGAVGMTRWLKRQFRDNTPYDQWVREIVLARGSTWGESPAGFYQVHADAEEAARAASQVFLGVRIECAQCHHHPFERWSQSDYYGFAGFFTGVRRKKSGGALKISAAAGNDLPHPRTGELTPAAGLGAEPAEFAEGSDRRVSLARWMTSPDNPFLAKMIANRLWSHYFDRGLVEPIDDLRQTNPATNEALLEALAAQLRDDAFDLKQFTRTLLQSQAYQRAHRPTENNVLDTQHYSHAAWKSLPAEVLLDAIGDVTESPASFNGWPPGVRAIEVWDNRMPSYFFQVFGRPQRVSVCECERGDAPSIAQALHLMNAPETVAKIRSRSGRAARLARSQLSPAEIIEELYLAALCRFPRPEESSWMQQAFGDKPHTANGERRRQAVEDVMWALLNSKEFVFNH